MRVHCAETFLCVDNRRSSQSLNYTRRFSHVLSASRPVLGVDAKGGLPGDDQSELRMKAGCALENVRVGLRAADTARYATVSKSSFFVVLFRQN